MVGNAKDTFKNSARRLYYYDNISSCTILIPTSVFEETTMPIKEEKWHSSVDIMNGVSYESGAITAQRKSYKVETKEFSPADTTPALNAALGKILDCKNNVGIEIRLTFVVVERDGTAVKTKMNVQNVITFDTFAITFDLIRRGAPIAYTATLS